jgi:hypothetical protein
VSVQIHNNADEDIHLLWVNFSGDEVAFETIGAGESYNAKSFGGHAWRAKLTSSPAAVAHEFVVADTSGSASMDVTVEGCSDGTEGTCGGGAGAGEASGARAGSVSLERHTSDAVDLLLQTTFAACDTDDTLEQRHVKGVLVLCVAPASAPEEGEGEGAGEGEDKGGGVEVLALTHEGGVGHTASFPESATGSVQVFRQHLEAAFRLRSRIDNMPWGLFRPDGTPVTEATASGGSGGGGSGVRGLETVLVFEGGNFVWPAIREGFERVVSRIGGLGGSVSEGGEGIAEGILPGGGNLTLRTLSILPRVFVVKRFLGDDECDAVRVCVCVCVRARECVCEDAYLALYVATFVSLSLDCRARPRSFSLSLLLSLPVAPLPADQRPRGAVHGIVLGD